MVGQAILEEVNRSLMRTDGNHPDDDNDNNYAYNDDLDDASSVDFD